MFAFSLHETQCISYVFTYYVIYLHTMCIIAWLCNFNTEIDKPDDVTVCEGRRVVFTCVLKHFINLRSDDVQWYRFIKDTNTTEMIDPNGENVNLVTNTIGSTINSSLNITNVIKSYNGYFWVGTPFLNVCNASLSVVTSMTIYSIFYVY